MLPNNNKLATLFILVLSISVASVAQNKYSNFVDSLVKLNKAPLAISTLEIVLNKAPKNEDALRALGKLYIITKQYQKAITYYNKVLVINPKCTPCLANLAIAQANNGSAINAVATINKAIAIAPTDAKLYINRAEFYAALNQKKEVLANFNIAIKLQPLNTEMLINRAKYFIAINENAKALDDFDAAINLTPKNDTLYFERANFYYNNKLFTEALTDCNSAITINNQNDNYFVGRGATYATLNKLDSCEIDYKNAITLNPNNFSAYYNLYLMAYKKEDMDLSCTYLAKTIGISKAVNIAAQEINDFELKYKDACDTKYANYYFQRGIANYNLKKYQEAINIYNLGLQNFPNNVWLMQFLGNAHLAALQYNNAIIAYNKSLQSNTAFEETLLTNPVYKNIAKDAALQMRNQFYADTYKSLAISNLKLSNNATALININTALSLFNNLSSVYKVDYYAVRSDIYNELQNFTEAKKDIETAILLDTKNASLYLQRAIIYYNLGQQNVGATKTSTRTLSFGLSTVGLINNGLNNNVTIPLGSKTKLLNNTNLQLAINDCNKALALQANLPFAFYLRGCANMQLGNKDFCADIVKAAMLGYPVKEEVLKGCK